MVESTNNGNGFFIKSWMTVDYEVRLSKTVNRFEAAIIDRASGQLCGKIGNRNYFEVIIGISKQLINYPKEQIRQYFQDTHIRLAPLNQGFRLSIFQKGVGGVGNSSSSEDSDSGNPTISNEAVILKYFEMDDSSFDEAVDTFIDEFNKLDFTNAFSIVNQLNDANISLSMVLHRLSNAWDLIDNVLHPNVETKIRSLASEIASRLNESNDYMCGGLSIIQQKMNLFIDEHKLEGESLEVSRTITQDEDVALRYFNMNNSAFDDAIDAFIDEINNSDFSDAFSIVNRLIVADISLSMVLRRLSNAWDLINDESHGNAKTNIRSLANEIASQLEANGDYMNGALSIIKGQMEI